MRLDLWLTENGYAESRQKAKILLSDGKVLIDGKPVAKAAFEMTPEKEGAVEVIGEALPYVSRGGLKLKGAVDGFGLSVSGLVCLDLGASTGGFTDCLLKEGAARVIAVDSGTAQLHKSLRSDLRVTVMENTNARFLTPSAIGTFVDLVTCDLSFISQTKVYGAVASVLKPGGRFVSLVKPQFEAGREHIGKNGIVRDPKVYDAVKAMIVKEAESYGLTCRGMIDSPITGGDGNREFLALFVKNEQTKEEKPNGTDSDPESREG